MLFWSGSGVLAKRIRCCSPSLCLFSLCPLGRAAAGAGGLRESSLRSFFFQCNTGKKNLFLQLSRFCIFRMDLQIMFEAYVMTHPPISFYLNKAGKSQVQIRECFSQPLKERLDEGGEAGEGKHLRGSIFYLFFIENEEDRGWSTVRVIWRAFSTAVVSGPSPRSARWPIGIAAFGLCLPLQIRIKNSGSARESAGNNRKEGVHVAARPLLSQWGSRFGID